MMHAGMFRFTCRYRRDPPRPRHGNGSDWFSRKPCAEGWDERGGESHPHDPERTGLATPGQLAQATGLSTGTITGIVDRLEKSGHAARKPNPDDRRSLLIVPSKQDALNRIMGPAFASLGAAMAAMSAKYTPEELAAIQRYLSDTTAVLREETQKLRGD